jgi:hypothetical protein
VFIDSVPFNVLTAVPVQETLDNGQELVYFTVEGLDKGKFTTHTSKRCMWNLTKFDPPVIVQVSKLNRQNVTPELYRQALALLIDTLERHLGGPVALIQTQSGMKSGTAYALPYPMFQEFVDGLGLDWSTDGGKLSSYAGLWFSDVAGDAFTVECKIDPAKHGEDGNGTVSKKVSTFDGQVRMGQLDELGRPSMAGKGTEFVVSSLDPRDAIINDTQIKIAPRNDSPIIVAPTPLDDRMRKVSATWMLVHLLEDVPEVWEVLEKRVRAATREKLEQLTGPRVNLLKRQGQLRLDEDGFTLLPADRTVFSALRSAMPYCVELETRLGRMYIKDLTQHVAPSGGLTAKGFLACQHDTLGVQRVENRDDAKAMAYRVPIVSTDNISWLPRKLRNGLVHPDVMDAAQGDSDGDLVLAIDDPEILDMFRKYLRDFHAGDKTDKAKSKRPISRTGTIKDAIDGYTNGALIGPLTMLMHQFLCLENDPDRAADAGNLAQDAPTLSKWDKSIDGIPLDEYMRRMLMSWSAEKEARAKAGMPVAPIQWREMQQAASTLDSPRELRTLVIEHPATLLDRCWNWMCDEVGLWDDATRPPPLNLVAVARLAYAAHPDVLITNEATVEVNEIKAAWGEYWADWFQSGQPERNHGPLYDAIEDMGKGASVAALIKLMEWIPANSDGAALKFCAIGMRWEEVLGLHPDVADWIINH